jgi:anti-sigma B factor antagonist
VQQDATVVMDIRRVNSEQAVVDVHGDLRMATVAASRKRLLQLARKAPRVLVLNLAAVQAVDTSGLAILVELLRVLQSRGGNLVLAEPHSQLRRMLQLTHLDQLFEMRDSVAQALTAEP